MTNRIRIKRQTGIFERAFTWMIISGVLLCTLSVSGYLLIAFVHRTLVDSSRNPMFYTIAGLGVVVVLLASLVAFYSVRKRLLQERLPGTMMSWLKSHIYIGLLAFVLAIIHAFIAIIRNEPSQGMLALIVFFLLVISGVVWRFVYMSFPPAVANSVGNLAVADTRSKSQIVQVEIDKLLAGKSAIFRRGAADGAVSGNWQKIEVGMRLPPNEYEDWDRLKHLTDRTKRYRRRERLQKWYAAFMQGWKWLHIPLAVLFLGLVISHVSDVFGINNQTANGSDLVGLPPSQACARCHQDIVQEWKLSMHSEAQTGPIMVAQTLKALENNPQFERACNNCHAPIGTALTQSTTLPLDIHNQFRSQFNGAVIDDGVNCIVCHTLSSAPEERLGMFDNFPVAKGELRSFADMFGPPLGDSSALPNAWHNSHVGFMTDNVTASQLCGSCHNVKVDINGNGEITAFPGSDGALSDTDGDNQLDENELDVDQNGKLQDLVLQTTFDEWEDYVAVQNSKGQSALGCVDCHMPRLQDSPVVTPESGLAYLFAPDRKRQSHFFVGVDYDLTPNHYTPSEFEVVQKQRQALLQSAATLSVELKKNEDDTLTASVTVQNNLVGHSLPTGFAFARQMWLEVSAVTTDGEPVCLTDLDVDGNIVHAQCSSGTIQTPKDDLLTCDPLALRALGIKSSKTDDLIVLNPESVAPLDNCDPWLANFQKILTRRIGSIFFEVPYQSFDADIVKIRVRPSDGQAMDPINTTILVNGKVKDSSTFDYVFNAAGLNGQKVIVNAVLHFRHLPPYFLRGLDGYYPDDLTSTALLENMTVVDMANANANITLP
jgi:hypothetical protein